MLRFKALSFLLPGHKIGGLRRRLRSFGNYISNIRTATSTPTNKVILREAFTTAVPAMSMLGVFLPLSLILGERLKNAQKRAIVQMFARA